MQVLGKSVCSVVYCKGTFEVKEIDVNIVDGQEVWPSMCPSCRSQQDFVTWETKTYEGDRWDGTPHEFKYKINKYF